MGQLAGETGGITGKEAVSYGYKTNPHDRVLYCH